MSVEIKPSATRAVDSYKKLQAAHAAAAAKIIEQDGFIMEQQGKIVVLEAKIAEAKAILDEVFPEDVGGSTGGVVG